MSGHSVTPPHDSGEAVTYLRALYAGLRASGGRAGIVGGPVGNQKWTPRVWRAVPEELDELAADALKRSANAFVNVNPMRPGVPKGKRGTASDVVALLGFSADLDLAVPGHKGDKARPPTAEAVWEAITAAGIGRPTMAVHTGGGCHAYWLLSDALELASDEERAAADQRAERFHGALDAAYEAAGWDSPDNVADLPRVLRVPGTVRTKEDAPDPLPVELLWADGPRYNLDELAAMSVAEELDEGEVVTEAGGEAMTEARWARRRRTVLDNVTTERSDEYGPELVERILSDYRDRLSKFNTGGQYRSGTYVELRDLACWAGAREAILGDELDSDLREAARASGLTARRGSKVVADLIATGLDKGRGAPYKPPVLRRAAKATPQASEAPDASSEDELEKRARLEEELDRPSITVNDRQLREIEAEVARALQRLNGTAPQLFDRGGEVVAVARARMRPVGEAGLSSFASVAADFYRVTEKGGARPVSPPRDALRALASRDAAELGLPPLDGFTAVPIMRADGTIRSTPGYDAVSRLFYAPTDGMVVDEIPAHPGADEVEKARRLLVDTWGEFPYRDQASRAHALALLLTAVLRPAVSGPVPLAVFTASTPGTGKSKLPETLLAAVTGARIAATPLPGSEEERRKAITASLRDDGRVLFLDNLDGQLRSGVLSTLLTSSVWSDRILGSSVTTTVPVRTVPVVTGNGVQLRGDLTRRAYYVELDAGLARPWLRDGFTYPNLVEHVLDNRAELVHAALVLGRAWFAAGRPAPTCPRLGSFEAWRTLIGGVLEHAGVEGFLANAQERIDDPDVNEWGAFVEALPTELGPQFTAAMVAAAITDRPVTWRELVPSVLASKVGRPDLAKAVGEAFNMRAGRRWDDSGLRLERAGRNRQKVALWSVAYDGPQGDDERPAAAGTELGPEAFPWGDPDRF